MPGNAKGCRSNDPKHEQMVTSGLPGVNASSVVFLKMEHHFREKELSFSAQAKP